MNIRITGMAVGMIFATVFITADDKPNFCIKNKTDRYIQFDVIGNGKSLYASKLKWIRPGEDFCDYIASISELETIHIRYCNSKSKGFMCTAINLKHSVAQFHNLKGNKIRTILLKFKVDEDDTPSLMPQEGVLKGFLGTTKVQRYGKTYTIDLKNNIGTNNIGELTPRL